MDNKQEALEAINKTVEEMIPLYVKLLKQQYKDDLAKIEDPKPIVQTYKDREGRVSFLLKVRNAVFYKHSELLSEYETAPDEKVVDCLLEEAYKSVAMDLILENIDRRGSGDIGSASIDVKRIRIHPVFVRPDKDKLMWLNERTPKSYRRAQDILVVAEKYVNGSGLFSSERSRRRKLQVACYNLSIELISENFAEKINNAKVQRDALIDFLSLLSDAHPNWQGEYGVLNRLLPTFFKG